jgi:hypothetical protein
MNYLKSQNLILKTTQTTDKHEAVVSESVSQNSSKLFVLNLYNATSKILLNLFRMKWFENGGINRFVFQQAMTLLNWFGTEWFENTGINKIRISASYDPARFFLFIPPFSNHSILNQFSRVIACWISILYTRHIEVSTNKNLAGS